MTHKHHNKMSDSQAIDKESNLYNALVTDTNAATTGSAWDNIVEQYFKDVQGNLAGAPSGHPTGSFPARRPN